MLQKLSRGNNRFLVSSQTFCKSNTKCDLLLLLQGGEIIVFCKPSNYLQKKNRTSVKVFFFKATFPKNICLHPKKYKYFCRINQFSFSWVPSSNSLLISLFLICEVLHFKHLHLSPAVPERCSSDLEKSLRKLVSEVIESFFWLKVSSKALS